ncbi:MULTISPECIES: hypothetical protein [Pedobacter]|uniref:Uncharacterized protein n=3 Tax=Pedobacter TaxID=84567 RepID=A0A369PZ46_9SPHI|nr:MULTISPECIES: hypothetical protein [Pedobacter]KQR68227.1 hypothetical protein ASF92_15265 [Pedobacter sp. Leaf176]MCZ4224668.1 hypothetical protein [Pedobacter sp. SJ11]RDC56026.1 hypothetical protein DU508_10360 [Pedobacter chinensis]RZJ89759.1 MAG: hypothetical protein EOO20_10065 [Chryseobacterium sp.]
MRKLLAKIDRIRASGWVTLDLKEDHLLYNLNGKRFQVESMATPDIKCRVSVMIEGEKVDLSIDDLY